MQPRFGLIERCGGLLFGGYLLFFVLRHDPHPRPAPGLLAIALPGYMRTVEQFNPLALLIRRLGIPAASFYSAGLLIVLLFLFVVYFHLLRGVRLQPAGRQARNDPCRGAALQPAAGALPISVLD